jgi:cell division septal protein FtsQ
LRAGSSARPPVTRLRSAPLARRAANRRLHPGLTRRRRLRAILAAGVPLGAILVFLACRAAFQEGLFRVREISFQGLVHTQPAVLVAEAGLARRHSMFDDFDFVSANLARDPLVREARVRRELPARLVVQILERLPAAYWAADSTLVPVDADGRVLPLDPARYGWDLPVLLASGETGSEARIQAGRLVDGDARALLRLVIGIRDRVPDVARRVSTAELEPDGRVVLRLMGEGGEVRLRLETPIAKVALLPDVVRDLELKRQGFETLDLSFPDQIVVRPVRLPDAAPGEPADGVVGDSIPSSGVGRPESPLPPGGEASTPSADPFASRDAPSAGADPAPATPPESHPAPLPVQPPRTPDAVVPGPAARSSWPPRTAGLARPASSAAEPSGAERRA